MASPPPLLALQQQGRYCDCVVTAAAGDANSGSPVRGSRDGATLRWRCHRVLLAARSPFFSAAFGHGSKDVTGPVEVPLPFPPQCGAAFGSLLPHLYDGELPTDLSVDNAVALLTLGACLGLEGLSERLSSALGELCVEPSACTALLAALCRDWLRGLAGTAARAADVPPLAAAAAMRGADEARSHVARLRDRCAGALVPRLGVLLDPALGGGLDGLPAEGLLSVLQHPRHGEECDEGVTSAVVARYLLSHEHPQQEQECPPQSPSKKDDPDAPTLRPAMSQEVFSQLAGHCRHVPAADVTALLRAALRRREPTLVRTCISAAHAAWDQVGGLDGELMAVFAEAGVAAKGATGEAARGGSSVTTPPMPDTIDDTVAATPVAVLSAAPAATPAPAPALPPPPPAQQRAAKRRRADGPAGRGAAQEPAATGGGAAAAASVTSPTAAGRRRDRSAAPGSGVSKRDKEREKEREQEREQEAAQLPPETPLTAASDALFASIGGNDDIDALTQVTQLDGAPRGSGSAGPPSPNDANGAGIDAAGEGDGMEELAVALSQSQGTQNEGVHCALTRLHDAMGVHRRRREQQSNAAVSETLRMASHGATLVARHCGVLWRGVAGEIREAAGQLAEQLKQAQRGAAAAESQLAELRRKSDETAAGVSSLRQQCSRLENALGLLREHAHGQVTIAGESSQRLVSALRDDMSEQVRLLEGRLGAVAEKNSGALKRLSTLLARELSRD